MPNCELCGEPMPEGEEMFKYHGYSGPCPKPPQPRLNGTCKVVAEYTRYEDDNHCHWIEVKVNGLRHQRVGPFDSDQECKRALDDLLQMMRSTGARDGSVAAN